MVPVSRQRKRNTNLALRNRSRIQVTKVVILPHVVGTGTNERFDFQPITTQHITSNMSKGQ